MPYQSIFTSEDNKDKKKSTSTTYVSVFTGEARKPSQVAAQEVKTQKTGLIDKAKEAISSFFQPKQEQPKLSVPDSFQAKPTKQIDVSQQNPSSARYQSVLPVQPTQKNIFDSARVNEIPNFSGQTISATPPKQNNALTSVLDKGKELWDGLFGITPQQRDQMNTADVTARAQNAYSLLQQKPELKKVTTLSKLSQSGGNPFKNSDFETYGAQAMRDAGVKTQPSNAEFTNLMMALSLPVSLGAGTVALAPSVGKQLLGLGSFTAVSATFDTAFHALTGKSSVSELLPEGTPMPIKVAVDALELLGKAYIAHGVYKKAPDIKDFFTKTTVEKYNLPQEITITSDQLRDIHQSGKLTTAEEKDLVSKAFAGREQEYKDAIKNKTDITITPERVVDLVDRPYWAKIKNILKVSPSSPTPKTVAGGIRFTSEDLTRNVTNSDLNDTPLGKQLLLKAAEAQKVGKDIEIVPNGGTLLEGETPQGTKLGYNLIDPAPIELLEESGKPQQTNGASAPIFEKLKTEAAQPLYSSAESFAQERFGTKVGSLIGEIDSKQVTARDPIDQGTVDEYKTRIQAGEAIEPIMVTQEDGKLITTDGSQRITAYQQLGQKAPVIVTKYSDPISGLKTIGDFYRESKASVPVEEPKPAQGATKAQEIAQPKAPEQPEPKTAESLKPVGEGKERLSRLEARMKNALDMTTEEAKEKLGVSTYNQMNKKENIAKAVEYVTNHTEEALAVLNGDKEAPTGLLRNSIYIAMDSLGSEDADIALKLASIQSTRFGQEISILSELNPNSPASIIKDVLNTQTKAVEKKSGKTMNETVKGEVTKIKKEIDKKLPNKNDWASFIKSIEC